jgi:hypothetical protein
MNPFTSLLNTLLILFVVIPTLSMIICAITTATLFCSNKDKYYQIHSKLMKWFEVSWITNAFGITLISILVWTGILK